MFSRSADRDMIAMNDAKAIADEDIGELGHRFRERLTFRAELSCLLVFLLFLFLVKADVLQEQNVARFQLVDHPLDVQPNAIGSK